MKMNNYYEEQKPRSTKSELQIIISLKRQCI